MCGIVGMVNGHHVAADLITALARLEYRGYDSAGIALAGSGLVVKKVVGRAADLAAALQAHEATGNAGIAVVHNGIIENHACLRADLMAQGHVFLSDTDSEVVPHLIATARRQGANHIDAVRQACAKLHGAYAIAVLFADMPDRLLVARQGSPVMVGAGSDVGAVASDPLALSGLCSRFTALEDGDMAEVSRQGVRIIDAAGRTATRVWQPVLDDEQATDLDHYEHHTRREIAEQPMTLRRTDAVLSGQTLPADIATAQRLVVVACGSSLYAAATARSWIERLSGLPCDIEIASEYRYREAPIAPGSVAVLVSQSGETADTLATLSLFQARAVPVVAVVNVLHSTLARAASLVWPISAGREQGVAATKANRYLGLPMSRLVQTEIYISRTRSRFESLTFIVGFCL